ncbi:MAG TPA: alpha-1,4-glucan--maltose-1-phosphate maltosyltransferase, partial [Sphingobacteriaceae bacterium]
VKKHDWKKTNRLTDIFTILNRARREHAALQSTWNIQFCAIEDPNLIAFLKATPDLSSIVLVVVNLDQHNRHSGYVQIPKERLKINGRVNLKLHDLMTDEHYTWTQDWNYVEIDPYKMPFHLFKLEVHESNM